MKSVLRHVFHIRVLLLRHSANGIVLYLPLAPPVVKGANNKGKKKLGKVVSPCV